MRAGLGHGLVLLLACVSAVCALDTVTLDLNKVTPIDMDSVLPRYYKPDTDQVCFNNGLRSSFCHFDDGTLVNLTSTQRHHLRKTLRQHGITRTVDVMSSSAHQIVDPSKAAVTSDEAVCFTSFLKSRDWSRNATNTVLNELYVRHIIGSHSERAWKIVSPTGCSEDIQRAARAPLEQPNAFADMTVWHPLMKNHNSDPWAAFRAGTDGIIKRSLARVHLPHRHARRASKDKRHASRPQGYGAGAPAFPGFPVFPGFPQQGVPGMPGFPPQGAPGAPGAPPQGAPGVPAQGAQGAGTDAGAGAGSDAGADVGAGAGISAGAGASATSAQERSASSSAITSKPHGFASSVTGGGNATPVIPKDIHELERLLADAQPRVIHLDKTYDYRGSMGVCTNCKGCIPDSYPKCPSKGQLAIDNGQGWCAGKPPHAVTYDKAGLTPLSVGSNKSIVGLSANAGIRGRGLLIAHSKNVIIHNLRIDQINAQFIWGGDAIDLRDTDLIWIDKVTFSLVGRQFIVTDYVGAGRVTISNCLFDGQTKWSATCDDSHYWTVLGYGKTDKVTFSGNMMHHCSGRSPRLANPQDKAGDSVWHVVNNLFDYNTGHSFDIGPGVSVLIEGNVFNDVAQTSLHESNPGRAFAPSDTSIGAQCDRVLGRNCQPNAYTNAKPIPSTTGLGEVLKDIALETLTAAMPPGDVLALVQKNAGSGSGSAANLSRGSADAVHSASTDNGAKPEGYGDVPTQPDSQQANAGTPANAADANAAKPKSQQDKNKQDKKKQAADKKKHDQQAKQLADQQKKQQAEQQKKQQQKQQKEQQEQQKKAAEAARKQAQGDAPQGY
ncbi:hypothetical protein PaG_05474 [Moesziomyces aphidis]|uniref:pectin lyase n=1 Tax=Moesziomyces aphidis TaxID=84754 RepID=W3VGB6_MOEAP|nr:hypothetical protein PaG_05474 [Moesziomyces aphidis]